jgi:hypothetical protein
MTVTARPVACEQRSRFAVEEWTVNIFSEEKIGADATQTHSYIFHQIHIGLPN